MTHTSLHGHLSTQVSKRMWLQKDAFITATFLRACLDFNRPARQGGRQGGRQAGRRGPSYEADCSRHHHQHRRWARCTFPWLASALYRNYASKHAARTHAGAGAGAGARLIAGRQTGREGGLGRLHRCGTKFRSIALIDKIQIQSHLIWDKVPHCPKAGTLTFDQNKTKFVFLTSETGLG